MYCYWVIRSVIPCLPWNQILILSLYFRRVYEWSERVEGEVKIGLDHIMCSMCHVRPQLFTQLLLNMAVLTVIDNNQSITDDR